MEYVTLANGKKIEWDEFSKWSGHKQKVSINPPNKGRKFGEEFKEKIRQARKNEMLNGTRIVIKGGDHKHARSVITPHGVFETIKEAGMFYKVRGSTLREWIKKGKEGFQFSAPPIERKAPSKKGGRAGSSNGSARAVMTPNGRFSTLREAAENFGVSTGKLSALIKKSSNGEFKYATEDKGYKRGINPNSRKVITPAGEFETIALAAKHFGVTGESIRYRAMSKHQTEYYFPDVLNS
jgi:hypothetical protein